MTLAPGRVNLIGEHTDYNHGFVLPMAIDCHVAVAVAPNGRECLRAHSIEYNTTHELYFQELQPPPRLGWFDYVAGVAWALMDAGHQLIGLDVAIAGNVPIGAGLSSSAALELASARAFATASSIAWDAVAMAKLAQRAENEYVGVQCGIMDQLAAAASVKGCALLVDCRTLEMTPVPVPPEATIIVMDTGTRRSLAAEAYNERRRSCAAAVELLQRVNPAIKALRDVSRDTLASGEALMDAVTFRRVQHVVAEIARTLEMAHALTAGDLERAGRLMNQSHESLRDLYEVSSGELDLITELAVEHPACFGARMTGAGFGGCALALVDAVRRETFVADVGQAYRVRTNLPCALYGCLPVEGAAVV